MTNFRLTNQITQNKNNFAKLSTKVNTIEEDNHQIVVPDSNTFYQIEAAGIAFWNINNSSDYINKGEPLAGESLTGEELINCGIPPLWRQSGWLFDGGVPLYGSYTNPTTGSPLLSMVQKNQYQTRQLNIMGTIPPAININTPLKTEYINMDSCYPYNWTSGKGDLGNDYSNISNDITITYKNNDFGWRTGWAVTKKAYKNFKLECTLRFTTANSQQRAVFFSKFNTGITLGLGELEDLVISTGLPPQGTLVQYYTDATSPVIRGPMPFGGTAYSPTVYNAPNDLNEHKLEIIANSTAQTITFYVDNVLIATGTSVPVDQMEGHIGFESEGQPVTFSNIKISPI